MDKRCITVKNIKTMICLIEQINKAELLFIVSVLCFLLVIKISFWFIGLLTFIAVTNTIGIIKIKCSNIKIHTDDNNTVTYMEYKSLYKNQYIFKIISVFIAVIATSLSFYLWPYNLSYFTSMSYFFVLCQIILVVLCGKLCNECIDRMILLIGLIKILKNKKEGFPLF